jgi:hypothetical protein
MEEDLRRLREEAAVNISPTGPALVQVSEERNMPYLQCNFVDEI